MVYFFIKLVKHIVSGWMEPITPFKEMSGIESKYATSIVDLGSKSSSTFLSKKDSCAFLHLCCSL